MSQEESFHFLEKRPKFSKAAIARRKKERIDKKKKKYEFLNKVSDEKILENEGKIQTASIKGASKLEKHIQVEEGNIAENLATAAEDWNLGDIAVHMNKAKKNHNISKIKLSSLMKKAQDYYVKKVFVKKVKKTNKVA